MCTSCCCGASTCPSLEVRTTAVVLLLAEALQQYFDTRHVWLHTTALRNVWVTPPPPPTPRQGQVEWSGAISDTRRPQRNVWRYDDSALLNSDQDCCNSVKKVWVTPAPPHPPTRSGLKSRVQSAKHSRRQRHAWRYESAIDFYWTLNKIYRPYLVSRVRVLYDAMILFLVAAVLVSEKICCAVGGWFCWVFDRLGSFRNNDEANGLWERRERSRSRTTSRLTTPARPSARRNPIRKRGSSRELTGPGSPETNMPKKILLSLLYDTLILYSSTSKDKKSWRFLLSKVLLSQFWAKKHFVSRTW